MLHHLSLGVTDLERACRFYDAALGALGYRRLWSRLDGDAQRRAVGYGREGPDEALALYWRPGAAVAAGPGFHLAFEAPDRAAVDAFHAAALVAGGRDDGAPGLRPHYGAHYYAAFVVDPDGHRLEAVVDRPD